MYSFHEYEADVVSNVDYPLQGRNVVYPALALAGEAGEFADKIKKRWRNGHVAQMAKFPSMREEDLVAQSMSAASMTPEEKMASLKELGDMLWYIKAEARELGFCLEDVARANVNKLADRRKRNVIASQGDNR